jgi:RNA polymerase sigma factor (sigma-70 family)
MERVTSRVVESRPGTTPAARTFGAFFGAEHARLKRAMFVVTGHDDEAEEVVQSAFVKLWERWGRVRNVEDPTAYLYRTAMNEFRSVRRRAARRLRGTPALEYVQSSPDVEARLSVASAVRALPERQRAAIVLVEYLEFSSEQAASILGIKASTVRNLAAQARANLKKALEGDR